MFYTAAFDAVAGNSFYGFGTLTMSNGSDPNVVITLGSVTDTSVSGSSGATTFWVWTEADPTTPTAGVLCSDHSPYATSRFTHFGKRTWAGALTLAFRAEAVAQGWGGKVPTISFSTTTGFYTLTCSGGNTAWTWSTDAGRQLLGFAADSSSAASHVGTRTPLYVISPTLSSTSEPTLSYEPRAIGNRIAADNGAGFGLARYVSPLYRDWRQEYETKAKTMRLEYAVAHPWTFQHLFEHCRGRFPFLVYDGGFEDADADPVAFTFREDGIPFVPDRATPGNDAQLHIPFRTVVEGTLNSGPQ